jgi:XapX domain-containing protein
MRVYLVSLAAGVLVGAIYGILGVRSPAPPVVALIGLFGMLLGEQGVAIVRRAVSGHPVTAAWVSQNCAPPILGAPTGKDRSTAHRSNGDRSS